MLLVLASRYDQQAAALVENWKCAWLLTPEDLSTAGWVYLASRPHEAVVVVDGRRVQAADISGVFTRIPHVMAHELDHIVSTDRDFVAAEMQAFLLAWLTSLRCPVVNRPTPACLAGPAWGPERWIHEAVKLGIPAAEIDRNTVDDFVPPHGGQMLTVIGRTVLGTDNERFQADAIRLARAADATVLTVYLQDDKLQGASPWIDITDRLVVQALMSYFHCCPTDAQ
jgi:hypothetical protein